MKYLSKEQMGYKYGVNHELFESVEEISKYALWFNYLNKNYVENSSRRVLGGNIIFRWLGF